MTPERFKRIKELFEEALDKQPEEREAFLSVPVAGLEDETARSLNEIKAALLGDTAPGP